MILCSDLYGELHDAMNAVFVSLPKEDSTWNHGFETVLECDISKAPYGPLFERYVDELTSVVTLALSRNRPNLVHAHHLGFGLSLAFCRAAQSLPLVSFAHGTDVIEAEASQQALSALCEVVARSCQVILPTRSLLERVQDLTCGKWDDKLRLISWGIPLDKVSSIHEPSEDSILRLLYAGRLDSNKAVDTVIEALAATESPHHLTVIGRGDQLSVLQSRAVELTIDHRVLFRPFVARDELWRRFRDYDALVISTAGLEAFGLVAIEAQAHGLPVIYSDVGGLCDILGLSGLGYRAGDSAELARTIDLLAQGSTLRRKLREDSLRNASRYDVRVTARAVLDCSMQAVHR